MTHRRPIWLVVGLLLLVAAAAAVLWMVVSGDRDEGAPRRSAAVPQPDPRVSADRARRLKEVRRRLRRLAWSPARPRLLSGRVTSSQGPAVAGAQVRVLLADGRVRVARTDADGQYRLANLPATGNRMEVSARGYRSRTFEPLKLPAAPRVRWNVVLEPAEGVHGIVLVGDSDTPASGTRLRLATRGRRRATLARVTADLGGRFSLRWPKDAGAVLLMAFHPQHGRKVRRIAEPGEVTVRLPGGGYVTGRVEDTAGRPVTKFALSSTSLARVGGTAPLRYFDDAQGRFRLGPLSAGRQRIHAVADGYQPGRTKPYRIRQGQTVEGVVIVLGESGELYGRVTDAQTGQPIRGALVFPAEWATRRLGGAAGAVADDGGNYVLRSVAGTRTTLAVRAEGYQPLMAGGVECRPGRRVRRDFRLTPLSRGERPRHQLTGIGAVLRKTPRGMYVQQLLDGGPAADALSERDLIVMVDDVDVADLSMMEVVQKIRGESGTDVVLWVRRGQEPPRRVVLTRARVSYPRKR